MTLLLDIGNTMLHWAVYKDGTPGSGGQFMHRGEDLARLAARAWGDMPVPGRVVIASVAGSGTGRALVDWLRQHWGVEPEFIRASARACGVTNAYVEPERLGVDRWASLVAMHRHYPGVACVVDCGTAITFDVISAAGMHQGGLILPGVEILKQQLLQNTADIHVAGGRRPVQLLASATADAVNGGAVYVAVAAIDRIITDLAAEYGKSLQVVLTGGDAPVLLPLLTTPAHHDPGLVLGGLAILAGEV